ncbi:hypothetical protein K438DRAFT_1025957 [Mycena galopus ATCC 62051]|nr:hypothetical protein K438DRAFT_1025957 [Mycena galopus ATCC 62051]
MTSPPRSLRRCELRALEFCSALVLAAGFGICELSCCYIAGDTALHYTWCTTSSIHLLASAAKSIDPRAMFYTEKDRPSRPILPWLSMPAFPWSPFLPSIVRYQCPRRRAHALSGNGVNSDPNLLCMLG